MKLGFGAKTFTYSGTISGQGNFKVANIDVNVCTHLVYAFAVLDTQSYTMKVFDPWLDETLENYKNFVVRKKRDSLLGCLFLLLFVFIKSTYMSYRCSWASGTTIIPCMIMVINQ